MRALAAILQATIEQSVAAQFPEICEFLTGAGYRDGRAPRRGRTGAVGDHRIPGQILRRAWPGPVSMARLSLVD